MERKLGRYLKPTEVVDHIDECMLHNDPKNLRVFESNAAHLKATITGQKIDLSKKGRSLLHRKVAERKGRRFVDNHGAMLKAGDWRLLQILHAHLLLDTNSPYLLGTHRYLDDRKIDWRSRPKLKDSLVGLCRRWELNRRLSELDYLL